ncbi:MAG: FMN-binding protein [Actinomycetes bacterium]
MKRALFVTAGTVAGVVASVSYAPAAQILASAHPGQKLRVAQADKAVREHRVGDRHTSVDKKAARVSTKKTEKDPKPRNVGGASSKRSASSGGGSVSAASSGTASTNTAPSGGDSGSKAPSKPSSKPAPNPKPTTTHSSAPTPKPSLPAVAKTFVGQAVSTPFGPVQVSIVVLDGRITDAAALTYPNADPKSVQIANSALPKLRSETLAAQSASIATVSGASYTSSGWISSLQSALSKAGL